MAVFTHPANDGGTALIGLLVDRWGAIVEEYDLDPGSARVSVDLKLESAALRRMRLDHDAILARRTRERSGEPRLSKP